jgi:hypothetical protein
LLDEIQSTISVSAYLVELLYSFFSADITSNSFVLLHRPPNKMTDSCHQPTSSIIFFYYSYVINFNDNDEWPRHTG